MRRTLVVAVRRAAIEESQARAVEGDPQSAELQKLVKERGAEHALDFVSQLRPWNPISKLIREEMKRQTDAVPRGFAT